MADSDSSSLSSAPSSEDEEMVKKMSKPSGIDRYFKPAPKDATPEPPKRAPSPPHEYTLADNEAIAFIVMFRSRFSEAFPKSLPHYGPQDIERGVSGELPDEQVERLLCALLGLTLNRKKDVELVSPSSTVPLLDQELRAFARRCLTLRQTRTLWPGTRRCDFCQPESMAQCVERG